MSKNKNPIGLAGINELVSDVNTLLQVFTSKSSEVKSQTDSSKNIQSHTHEISETSGPMPTILILITAIFNIIIFIMALFIIFY